MRKFSGQKVRVRSFHPPRQSPRRDRDSRKWVSSRVTILHHW